tara:strand:- start:880 stop:1158 length:279 start_codon:yes stop_codon:yes gene_type:complete
MNNSTLQRLQVESECSAFFKHLDEQKATAIKHKELKEKQASDFMLNNYYIIDNYREMHTANGDVIAYSHVPKGKVGVSYSDWCSIFNIICDI